MQSWSTEPVVDFGTCLQDILKKKKMSASELARLTGYKSRNSIFRILDGVGGHAVRRTLLDRLTEADCLHLTAQERDALLQALEVSRVGRQGFLSNCALREMLMDGGCPANAQRLWVVNHRDGRRTMDLETLMSGYAGGRQLTMMILGCCEREIFEAMHAQLVAPDIPCKVRVEHFMYAGGDEIIRNISAIQPMLYTPCYMAYCMEPGSLLPERERIYRNNLIHLRWEDAEGVWHEHILWLTGGGQISLFDRVGVSSCRVLHELLDSDRAGMYPLKSSFALNHGPEDYLTYTEEYEQLEYNKPIYTLKLDVPINFIHPDILLPSVIEGFTQTGFANAADMRGLVSQFYSIHLRRWENFFTKRKPTYTIFSRAAMEAFARTGEQSDHFFAMRPYTPEERVAILIHLKEQAAVNPYFNIYFFKPDFSPPLMEVGLYEGTGTLISKAYTHYDLGGSHAEALITQPEFCRQYRAYFLEDLLVNRVLAPEETQAVFDELIAIAQKA